MASQERQSAEAPIVEDPSQTETETHNPERRELSPLPDLGGDIEVMRTVRKKSRNLWGMYATTVLRGDGAGSRQASPTRGAQELGRRLRSQRQGSATALGEVGASASGSSASPVSETTAEEDLVATLPISEPDDRRTRADSSETVPGAAEAPLPFEVLRARQRAARAREYAAQVVARAREERVAAVTTPRSVASPPAEESFDAKLAMEKTPEAADKPAAQETQVRRRIVAKQKDPANVQLAKEAISPLSARPTPLRNLKRQAQVALLATPPCSKQPRGVAKSGHAAKKQAA